MATKTWTDTSSGYQNWSQSADWAGGLPGASDTAVIAAGTSTCTIDDTTKPVTVRALSVQGGLVVDSPPNSGVRTSLTVEGGVTVGSATDGSANFVIDNDANTSATEGSTVVIKGTLRNYDAVSIGSGAGSTYTTDVTVGSIDNTGSFSVYSGPTTSYGTTTLTVNSAAGFGVAGTVEGYVLVDGAAARIDFKSGGIDTIASGANLILDGTGALVTSTGRASSDSALTGLKRIDGNFTLAAGGKASITGNVDVTGSLNVLHGSTLSIAGGLTNDSSVNGTITVAQDGGFGGSGGGETTLTVGSFTNKQTTGFPARLFVSGGSTAADESIVYDKSVAGFGRTGIVDGLVQVSGDAFIDFKSGQIAQVAANGNLTLIGDDAFVASGSATTTNSALTKLVTVAGTLALEDGASLSTGSLTDSGQINVVAQGDSASGLTIKGTLTDTGSINVDGDTGSGNLGRLYVSGKTGGTHGSIDLGSDSRVSLSRPSTTT